MYAKIHNPKTNRNVSINSTLGKKILKSYLSKSGLLGGTGQTGQTGLTEGLTDDQARAIETLNLLKQKGLHVSVAKQVSRINLPSRFNIGDTVQVLPDHEIERLRGRHGRIESMKAVPMYEQDASLLSGQDPIGNYGRYNYQVYMHVLNETVTLKEGEFWLSGMWGMARQRNPYGTTASTSYGVAQALRPEYLGRRGPDYTGHGHAYTGPGYNSYRSESRDFVGLPWYAPRPSLNSAYHHPLTPPVSEIARDSTGTPLLLEDGLVIGERARAPYHAIPVPSIPEGDRRPAGVQERERRPYG